MVHHLERDGPEEHRLEAAAAAGAEGDQIEVGTGSDEHLAWFALGQAADHWSERATATTVHDEIERTLEIRVGEVDVTGRSLPRCVGEPCVDDHDAATMQISFTACPIGGSDGCIRTVDADEYPPHATALRTTHDHHRAGAAPHRSSWHRAEQPR